MAIQENAVFFGDSMMNQARCPRLLWVVLILVGVLSAGCPAPVIWDPPDGFVAISKPGLGSADTEADRKNDYPSAMTYFKPDNAEEGSVYVGTGNAVMDGILGRIFGWPNESIWLPPSIRRYRPDLDALVWETVLDWRDLEPGPPWETTWVRALRPYRVPATGESYLYAGTFGTEPTLWRSRTGDAGTWEPVWSNPTEGSIRCLTVHNDLLYIGITHEYLDPQVPGEIYATDGQDVWSVMTDGFGTVNNDGIFAMESFNGWLYAGTINRNQGYEVWKLEGPDGQSDPVRIIANGGTTRAQQAVSDMRVFQDHLYVASIIFINVNWGSYIPLLRAADMVRIDREDGVEVVAGPRSVGGVPSGFGHRRNAYLWVLEEHGGKLYCGTFNATSFWPITERYWERIQDTLNEAVGLPLFFGPSPIALFIGSGAFDALTDEGARLYSSEDGVVWNEVFRGGLGNPRNYGVRNMVSTDDTLYIGLSNIEDGLQIWAYTE